MHILGGFVSKTFTALTSTRIGSPLTMIELHNAFKKFDLNGDGRITRDELATAMTSFGNRVSDEEIDQILHRVDQDGNGVIDFPEFLALMELHRPSDDSEQEIRMLFQQIDKNGDGFISEKELKKMMKGLDEKVNKKDVKQMMKFADSNKDGKICFTEFKGMVEGNLLG